MKDLRVVRISLDSEEGKQLREFHEKHGLKIKPGVKEMVRVYCTGTPQTVTVGKEEKPGVLITTPDQDRMGEVVDPKGVELTHYLNNPVILWAHNYNEPPIGSSESIKVTEAGIVAVPRWASTQRAQEIKTLYDEGHMRAWSIGFIPKEWVDGNGEGGAAYRTYTKWELLEFSAVPVPANPHALSERIHAGMAISKALQMELGLQAKGADSSAQEPEAEGDTSSNDDSDLLAQMTSMIGELQTQLIAYVNSAMAAHEAAFHAAPDDGPAGAAYTGEPKIRILNDVHHGGSTPPAAEPVLRVEGKLMTSSEVRGFMEKSVDAVMRRITGRVS